MSPVNAAIRCLALFALLAVSGALPARSQALPADATTHHTLELPGRTLQFSATAGAIRLADDKDTPRAEVAFIAYRLDGADPHTRPVTFVLNGGPGFASGWLNVGAAGPWRIPLANGDTTSPSASPAPIANADTWLDFTDLVFIDPAGTGYSRILTGNQEERRRFWSVGGDIDYLAETIRKWLVRFDRSVSPKYLLGESYGGFRAPRLARELADRQGTGISGLVLVSPALDIGGRDPAFEPFTYVASLPSMTAAARAAHGPVTRADLADVERYARTDFLLDLVRGQHDPEAIARRSDRVAAFTGLDAALVRQHDGLIDRDLFLHELDRARHRVGSEYDATITSADPFPQQVQSDYADPVLDALLAPVSSAMVTIYQSKLNWRPDSSYELWNQTANHEWNWGHGPGHPQSVSALRTALALDPHLTVLIAHGMFDLVTPYFGTQLLLDQIPDSSGADRIRLMVYPGGHMFYTNDNSRAALHDDAKAMYSAHEE
jgi:carboxypeptidase C (cathepsin A)